MKQRLLARLELSLKWRWAELAENDVKFKRQFNKVFNNTDIKEADNGFAINLYDQYINMELTLDQGRDIPEFARVKKMLKDANVSPNGVANENPILDSRMYEMEYNDGHTSSLEAILVAENLFAQFDQAGNRFTILDSITGTRTDSTQVLQ